MVPIQDSEGPDARTRLDTSSYDDLVRWQVVQLAKQNPFHKRGVCTAVEDAEDTSRARLRGLDEKVFWETMSQLAPVRNPSQQSVDLLGAFVNSYWSNAASKSMSQYITIYHWMAPRGPALDKARDTLYLLHLGTRHGDRRLLLEARTRHCEALQRLRLEIQRPGAINDDSILGASFTIAQCEVYRIISCESGGWTMHVPGMLALFRQRGAKSIRSPYARAALNNVKQVVAMYGLLTRKKVPLGSPTWRSPSDRQAKPALRLLDIFFRIGEFLQRTDELCASKTREQDEAVLVSTLTAMVDLERQLQQWLLDFYASTGEEAMPYTEVNPSSFLSFTQRCGRLDTFPKVFQFSSFLSATSHVYVWTGLLELRKAIADVARLHPYPLVRPVNQDAMLVAAIDEVAGNLSKSVPYISERQHGFAGLLACGTPLYFAEAWYRQRQDYARVTWCETVREALQQDSIAGHTFDSVDLQHPVLTWWMLPDIFEQPAKDKQETRKT